LPKKKNEAIYLPSCHSKPKWHLSSIKHKRRCFEEGSRGSFPYSGEKKIHVWVKKGLTQLLVLTFLFKPLNQRLGLIFDQPWVETTQQFLVYIVTRGCQTSTSTISSIVHIYIRASITLKNAWLFQPKFGSNMDKPKC